MIDNTHFCEGTKRTELFPASDCDCGQADEWEREATADFAAIGDHPHKCAVCNKEWTCLVSFCVRLYVSICDGCMAHYSVRPQGLDRR